MQLELNERKTNPGKQRVTVTPSGYFNNNLKKLTQTKFDKRTTNRHSKTSAQ